MREHPVATLVRRVYEATRRGDDEALSALIDGDTGWRDATVRRTPLSIVAVEDIAVVIEAVGTAPDTQVRAVSLFRVTDGRVRSIDTRLV